jgi:hypothetical protein
VNKVRTNTELLDKKIKDSGKKIGFLAEKCGLSLGGFYNCRTNRAEFTATQIKILCVELYITDLNEREAIFFAPNGA